MKFNKKVIMKTTELKKLVDEFEDFVENCNEVKSTKEMIPSFWVSKFGYRNLESEQELLDFILNEKNLKK